MARFAFKRVGWVPIISVTLNSLATAYFAILTGFYEKQNSEFFTLLAAATGNHGLSVLAYRAFSAVTWFNLPATVPSGSA